MYNFLFAGAAANHRRFKQCACGVLALLVLVIVLFQLAPEPHEPGSQTWETFMHCLLVAMGGLAIYWMSLLMKLCETLGLNAPLLMFMSVAFAPFSIMVIHLFVAAKLDAYFGDGGG